MATDVERLVAVLEARTTAFEKAMNKAVGVSNQRARQIEQRFDKMNGNINRSFQNLLRGGVAAIGGLGLRQLQQMADTWTDYSARVGLAIKSMDAAPAVMERIYQMAQRTYSAMDTTAESFIQNSNTLRELGKSTKEQLDYTEALNNALVVSGAKAQRAESIQNALAKAMAAGVLRGENLNTVIQQGGRVAEALADELGISTLELGKVGQQGKITGDIVYNALTKRLETLREEAEAMPATISDGFLQIRNALTRYVGQMDQASGVSGAFASGLVFVADHFDSIAAAAAVAGSMLLGRYVPGLVRATVAQAAMVATNPFLLLATAIGGATFALHAFGGDIQPVAGEMATLHDYAGAAWDAIKDGAMSAGAAVRDGFLTAINLIVDAMGGVEMSWEDVWAVVKRVANQIIGEMMLMYDTIVIAFTKLPQAVAESVINAMNYMVGLIESGINKVIDGVNRAISALNSLGSWAGMGEVVGEIGAVELGRLENSYAGAGQAAADAYGEALRNAARDHIGAVGEAWSRAANNRAAARAVGEEDGSSLGAVGSGSAVSPSSGGGGRKGRKERENELQREIEQIKERTAALHAETEIQSQLNPLINDYDYAITKARSTQELLNAAKKAGIEITPALRAQIDQLAESYAQATVEAGKLSERQENLKAAVDDFKSTTKDVMSGFIHDLKDGKTAAEALANALNKIVDKLIDSGLEMALNGLFKGLTGGSGLLGSLFGFAEGGYTGAGSRNQPAGVVHKGEYVFSKAAVDRIGAGNLEAMHRNLKGYANGGLVSAVPNMLSSAGRVASNVHVTVGVAADGNGNLMPFVQSVTQDGIKRAAPGILSASIQQSRMAIKGDMPGLIANTQTRNL